MSKLEQLQDHSYNKDILIVFTICFLTLTKMGEVTELLQLQMYATDLNASHKGHP